MNIPFLSFIATALQTLIVFISVILFYHQLKQFNQTLHQDAYSKAVDYYVKTNELLIEKPSLTRFFYSTNPDFFHLNQDQQDFYNYLGLILGFFEHLYLLSKKGWVDSKTWESWERWLIIVIFPTDIFDVFWKNERVLFHVDFYKYVDKKYGEQLAKKAQERSSDSHVTINSAPGANPE